MSIQNNKEKIRIITNGIYSDFYFSKREIHIFSILIKSSKNQSLEIQQLVYL